MGNKVACEDAKAAEAIAEARSYAENCLSNIEEDYYTATVKPRMEIVDCLSNMEYMLTPEGKLAGFQRAQRYRDQIDIEWEKALQLMVSMNDFCYLEETKQNELKDKLTKITGENAIMETFKKPDGTLDRIRMLGDADSIPDSRYAKPNVDQTQRTLEWAKKRHKYLVDNDALTDNLVEIFVDIRKAILKRPFLMQKQARQAMELLQYHQVRHVNEIRIHKLEYKSHRETVRDELSTLKTYAREWLKHFINKKVHIPCSLLCRSKYDPDNIVNWHLYARLPEELRTIDNLTDGY